MWKRRLMTVLIALISFCLGPLLIVTRNSAVEIIPLSNFLLQVFLPQSSELFFITELMFQERKGLFSHGSGTVLLTMDFLCYTLNSATLSSLCKCDFKEFLPEENFGCFLVFARLSVPLILQNSFESKPLSMFYCLMRKQLS